MCSYLIDPAYQWSSECEQRFGTHPIQVVQVAAVRTARMVHAYETTFWNTLAQNLD